MPALKGSPPFSCSREELIHLLELLALCLVGAAASFTTSNFIPWLKEHAATDLGLFIVSLLSAVSPVIVQGLRKFFGDTTGNSSSGGSRTCSLLLPLMLVLACASGASAADVPTGGALGQLLHNLVNDPLLAAAVLIGASIFASKVLHIDLSALVIPLITSLLKPPTPTPTPGPSPTPTPTPAPVDPQNILQQLLNLLLAAKTNGDKEQEAAVLTLIGRLTQKS